MKLSRLCLFSGCFIIGWLAELKTAPVLAVAVVLVIYGALEQGNEK